MPRVPFARPDDDLHPPHILAMQYVVTTALLTLIQSRSPYLQVSPSRMDAIAPDGIHMLVICEPVANNGPNHSNRQLLIAQLRLAMANGTTEIIHTVLPAAYLTRLPTAETMLAAFSKLIGANDSWVNDLTIDTFDDTAFAAETDEETAA